MEVFRITLTKWANNLIASGYAARWNSKGRYVLYCAATRSLACLENIVHRNRRGLNDSFRTKVLDIDSNIKMTTVKTEDIANGWYDTSPADYLSCQNIGDQWINEGNTCILQVPSGLIHQEYNFLIKPNHRDFDKISFCGRNLFSSIREF